MSRGKHHLRPCEWRLSRPAPTHRVIIMARKNREVETRMVSEYLLQNYAKFPYQIKVPLGTIPNELLEREGYYRAMRIYRPSRQELDALVVLPRHLLLIEAKFWNIINGLSKLPMYKSLVPITPELQQYMPRDILMQLVVAWTNPNIERMCQDAGVELRIFCPDWLKEIVDSMHKYWTKEYQAERLEKFKMREYFGVE